MQQASLLKAVVELLALASGWPKCIHFAAFVAKRKLTSEFAHYDQFRVVFNNPRTKSSRHWLTRLPADTCFVWPPKSKSILLASFVRAGLPEKETESEIMLSQFSLNPPPLGSKWNMCT